MNNELIHSADCYCAECSGPAAIKLTSATCMMADGGLIYNSGLPKKHMIQIPEIIFEGMDCVLMVPVKGGFVNFYSNAYLEKRGVIRNPLTALRDTVEGMKQSYPPYEIEMEAHQSINTHNAALTAVLSEIDNMMKVGSDGYRSTKAATEGN